MGIGQEANEAGGLRRVAAHGKLAQHATREQPVAGGAGSAGELRVVVATAELSPLARTGGLGDAVAGLSRALQRAGIDVMVAMPRYPDLADIGEPGAGAGPARAVYRGAYQGLPLALIDDPEAFDRPGTPYGPSPGMEHGDSWWRWGRFALAVAEVAEDADLVHLQDAHTGAVALISPVPCVFTVHNPAHPVLGPLLDAGMLLDVGGDATAPEGALEWYGRANYLKAGLVGSAQATTVSPTFAMELAGPADESFGLGDVVRALDPPLAGILNGIAAEQWDPATDPLLPAPFSADDLAGRTAARAALVKRAGLSDGTVFGNVGRVSAQKGYPILDGSIDDLVAEGFRFVQVGNGDLDEMVDAWADRHPRAVAHFAFDDDIARLTFGGADAYLMPSRFEPSGLGQLYAMRYGCPPVVRLTGGLADTVVDLDEAPGSGTGFGFRPYLVAEAAKTIRRAMRYHQAFPDLWAAMQRRGMSEDLSWQRRAREYVDLYRAVLA